MRVSRTSLRSFDADKFRALRTRSGYTISSLARSAGVHHSTISQWENCVTVPTGEVLGIVMATLGANIDEVLSVNFGDATLTDLRVMAGCSRAEVQEHLNLSVSGWGDIERGDSGLSSDKAQQLAEFFNVPVDIIIRAAKNTLGR